MSGAPERRIVLTPSVLGAAFIDEDCSRILTAWRDKAVVPVVSRQLLRRYLKLLSKAGVHARLLNQWGLWFTSPATSIFAGDVEDTEGSLTVCVRTAVAGAATMIITGGAAKGLESAEPIELVSAKAFGKRFVDA